MQLVACTCGVQRWARTALQHATTLRFGEQCKLLFRRWAALAADEPIRLDIATGKWPAILAALPRSRLPLCSLELHTRPEQTNAIRTALERFKFEVSAGDAVAAAEAGSVICRAVLFDCSRAASMQGALPADIRWSCKPAASSFALRQVRSAAVCGRWCCSCTGVGE